MSKENFGEALRGSYEGKKPKKEGREARPIPHDEETAEEAERLSGSRRRDIENFPDPSTISPEDRLLLRETLREALDPKNKNSRAAWLLREEARGLMNEDFNPLKSTQPEKPAILRPKKKRESGAKFGGEKAA